MKLLTVALGTLALGGCDLKLAEPRYLWLAWLVPLLAGFLVFASHRRQRLIERLVSTSLARRLVQSAGPGRRRLKAILVVVALAAMVLALAQPRYGFAWEDVRRRGVDLVIAFDVSDSMLVRDGAPGDELTRLTRAKRKVRDLLGMLDGDRVGIVAFAGAAFLECPLTTDYGAAAEFLDELDPESISAKGTALGEAVRAALKAFAAGTGDARAILLITDGEDTTGDAQAAADEAKKQGVRIFAVGVGREEGAPVPNSDGSFRRDRRGELVLSKLDERTLQAMALGTNGAYARSVLGDVDLETIYRGIKSSVAARDFESQRRQRWHERFQWLVALALAALAAEALLPERARRASA